MIGVISCEKDNTTKTNDSVAYDTIKPLEYFPAFPGSYWIYDNNDTLKVADHYEMYVFNSAGYTAEPDYDTLILPKLILNGIYNRPDTFAYVNGYSISKAKESGYRDPAFKELLSLTEGAEFIIGGADQGHRITGKTIKVDTTIYIGTTEYRNVIVTIQFDYACVLGPGNSPENCATLREYYAKDVGLIKRERKNFPINTDFVKDIELIKFLINK
ncbi:MAG TPA: hypothetical protein PK990_05840 [Salinivirgaceae bacterium]|nr:hypothetical protein [Salinivirgaceae bacterium]